jgi:hypothetical protein
MLKSTIRLKDFFELPHIFMLLLKDERRRDPRNSLIDRLKKVTIYFRVLLKARRELSPDMSQMDYCKKWISYRNYWGMVPHCQIERDALEEYLKNDQLQKNSELSNFKINCHGFENYWAAKKRDRSIILVTWHHGMQGFTDRAVAGVVPDVVRIGKYGYFPYKKNINIILKDSIITNAFVIAKKLEEKHTVLNYIDGPAGKILEFNLFGMKIYLPSGYIKLARHYDSIVIPVTCYLNGANEIDLYAGKPLFDEKTLEKLSDREAIQMMLDYLKRDLMNRNPAAINIDILRFNMTRH